MQAIRRRGGTIVLESIPNASLLDDEVVVRIVQAGLCRTDLYVAEGRFSDAADLVTLDHELAGVVEAIGRACTRFTPGDHVTVDPEIRCGSCRSCHRTNGSRCPTPSMIGLHRDGAFADQLLVPQSALRRLPPWLPFELGAYTEPGAAARVVLHVPLDSSRRGVVLECNRIASLVTRTLAKQGFRDLGR